MAHVSSLDLRCYVITGRGDADHIVRVASEAARGGAGVIQVRSKPIDAGDLFALAERVAQAVAQVNTSTKILIDDRVDVALALINRGVPIHGVHLGQSDLPVQAARELLGPEAIIGLTTGTEELVRSANEVAECIDYIGAGPFRPTPTKDSGRPPIGLGGYPRLVELSELPIVAIGDVQPADVANLAMTGVAGSAMVRAFMDSPDPYSLAQQVVAHA
ncbi:thiamine phosphate synthase [Corynebacterium sp. S7]